MSAQIDYSKYNANHTIDEFMRDEIIGCPKSTTSILNLCIKNGVMGRTDQLKLRELYPNLFDEAQKFLAKSKRGNVFIYTEEGKPPVINVFIYENAKDKDSIYIIRRNAGKSIRRLVNNIKLPSSYFVWINDEEGAHKKLIDSCFKYGFGYNYRFTALREQEIEIIEEQE